MAKKSAAFYGFNRGLVSKLALARVDMKRLSFSAEIMTNWMPRVLGSMMFRPGLGYLGSTHNDAQARFLPFIFSTDDLAAVELTDSIMRVWVDDEVITRPSVTSAVLNGNFDSNLTDWADNDEVGAASAWFTGGYMELIGDGTASAFRDQQITVAGANIGVEHGLKIVILRGPVMLRVGSAFTLDDYVAETMLDTGEHSLAFTPTGNFFIRFGNELKRAVYVDSCNVESAGAMTLTAPWPAASLRNVRADQSGDILFCACKGFLQRKIERRGLRSWSLVRYLSDNGPYLAENKTETTMAVAALSGNTTLTASRGYFSSDHIGCLFKLRSVGQRVTANIAAQNTFTSNIEASSTGEQRRFAITLTGTWSATVTLQRSIGVTGNWVDVTNFTSNTATTYNDSLDNQLVFYRIGIKTGNYGSGTVTATLDYPLGSKTGVGRVTNFTNETTVLIEVLSEFGSTDASKFWSEGSWSTISGFPSAVAFYEGRLWWAGKNGIYGSVSDDFYNFNPDTVGDSGPINRTVGSGPVDDINWLLPLQRLIVGAEGAEHSVRATSFDEVLTPTNFNIKEASSQGSNSAIACKIDSRGVFVQRGGTRLFELAFDGEVGDYASTEDTIIVPEVGEPGIIHVAVQRLPDTRVHCIRSDGTAAVLIHNHVENVMCWVLVETDGDIEDAMVLPGDVEDCVYYVVKRTINGVTKRYYELWALESEARGDDFTKTSDCHASYSGAATSTLGNLSHLEGKEVTVWGNGKDLGRKTVVSGQITTLPEPVTTAVIGLPYTAQWKSTKLAYANPGEAVSLTFHKRITQLGFVLADAYYQSLTFGPNFDTMDDMPLSENSQDIPANVMQESYDEELIEFPGEWNGDARLCIQAESPRPVTILAAVLAFEVEEKS